MDESAGQRSAFSPAFIGLVAGAVVLGAILGYFFASSSQAKRMYNAQTEAAKQVRDRVKPSVEAAKQINGQIAKIAQASATPDYESAAKLVELKFVPEASSINSLVGGSNTYNINQFMAKASVLQQLLKQHNHLTNNVDRKELEELVKNNEIVQGNKKFAVIYNYKTLLDHLQSKKTDAEYKPTEGRLVAIEKFEVDEKGEVSFLNLSDNKQATYSVRGVIPLNVNEILKTGGQNALQRYKQRVETLRFYAEDLDKSTQGLLEGLDKLADRGEAPFIQLSSSSPEPAAQPPAAQDAAP